MFLKVLRNQKCKRCPLCSFGIPGSAPIHSAPPSTRSAPHRATFFFAVDDPSSTSLPASAIQPLISDTPDNSSDRPSPGRFIPAELDQTRLDKAVKVHFDLPWNKARSWIGTGKIFLNGTRVLELDRLVAEGDRIELRISAPRPASEAAFDPKNVLHFDDHIVVVNKPAGLLTVPHPEAPGEPSLDRLTQAFLRKADRGSRQNQASLGVAHRIDKDTSGLVVFARTSLALKGLTEQFRAHSIQRRYLAIVHGSIEAQTLRSHLLRDTGQGLRGSAPQGQTSSTGETLGRLAITHVSVEESLPAATLVSCRIETGRTHQIRIHLSETGHPIVGEKVYIRNYEGPLIAADRVLLHAAELGFIHPASGQTVQWTQPLPQDFRKRLKTLRSFQPRKRSPRS
ncbi:RluA family pseudouridine synthase [Pelagicoccus sp. SDUM812003]|uniref:RluA family pseudouridine synthase n=1 Tax=Pelagicoccus sp. SDUM812003 TaxID=3041267 RepID=UPI00280D25D2|nr:RluA family pseudouridine synthase [Pelagicoccus sp. SDUM812003]MDQ8203839.1 RluA family pseudouridine synthase [Pelagicoccus sp. SDUM812003]